MQVSQLMIIKIRVDSGTDNLPYCYRTPVSNLLSRQDDRAKPGLWLIANMVVGADGSTLMGGRSTGLSSAGDRKRFHQLREAADAILIGGETARRDPYAQTPKPLVVMSRTHNLPEKVLNNPLLSVVELPVLDAIAFAQARFGPRILMEAGPSLLLQALNQNVLSEFYLTITPHSPNENVLPLPELYSRLAQHGLVEVNREEIAGDIFLHFSKSTN
jgi:riboflavin biosynthesis pyrimidine reductase